MKKNVIKLLSLIMALLMTFSAGTVALAETDDSSDNEIVYRFTTIGSTAVGFSISGLTASCSAKLSSKYSTSLYIKMELQKKSGGSYSTVKTWTKSYNGTGTTLNGSKVINPLSTYRLKVTFKADNETFVTYKS